MDLAIDIQNKLKRNWIVLLCGFITIYFIFSIFCGNRNIYRFFTLHHEISKHNEILSKLQAQKKQLQSLVDRLSDKSLDADLLDERARIVLNLVADDDFVILDDNF